MLMKAAMNYRAILACLLVLFSTVARADELDDAVALWTAHAPVCSSASGFVFPAKAECEDSDMTLFNGLLCAADVSIGCAAVKRAMNASGRWHRSPRLAEQPELRPKDSFSPDMALGVQLYLIKTRDIEAATQWIAWLQTALPCWTEEMNDVCFRSPFPRFCTDDSEKGCTIRPGDASMLGRSFQSLGISVPVDTPLGAYLRTMRGDVTLELALSAMLNRPGYPRHLTATGILLARLGGVSEEEDRRLAVAARILAEKDRENPFFAYLAGTSPETVQRMLFQTCPTDVAELPARLGEWSWEMAASHEYYGDHMLWDCIFMAELLRP